MRISRCSLPLVFACVLLTGAAHAEDDNPCIPAYTLAQSLQKDGKVVAAKAQAAICAQASCDPILAKDCTQWLADLEKITPSIVLDVRDEERNELVDVRVTMDGEPFAHRLDGRAVEVDPGMHELTFEAAGFAPLEKGILVREADKGQRIQVTLIRSKKGVESRPVPFGVWAFGGAAVVALGVSTVFAIDGISRKDDLEACRPRCAPEDVDAMSARFTVADVALGAGLMAGAAAVYLFLTRPTVNANGPSRIGIVPTGVVGRF